MVLFGFVAIHMHFRSVVVCSINAEFRCRCRNRRQSQQRLGQINVFKFHFFYYSFIIDDCKRLRNDKYVENDDKLKLI